MSEIRVLTPTGTSGYGFGEAAFKRAMSLKPDVIAVDAGSTDPGPYHLGSGKTLVSDDQIRRELTTLIRAARAHDIPLIVGSAGGSGAAAHPDRTADIVGDVARCEGLTFRLAVNAIVAAMPDRGWLSRLDHVSEISSQPRHPFTRSAPARVAFSRMHPRGQTRCSLKTLPRPAGEQPRQSPRASLSRHRR